MSAEDRKNLGRVTGVLDPDLWKALTPGCKRQLLSYAKNRFDGERPLAICWNPGTAMGLVEAFHAVEEAARVRRNETRVGAANQIDDHWNNTAIDPTGQNVQGRPVTLTWSFIPDGTGIPAAFAEDSSDVSDFLAWIVGIYGGNAALPPDDPANDAWFSLFEDMFASYAAKTGLRYVYEPNDDGSTFPNASGLSGTRGDVRIGGHMIDGNSGTLAYNYFPDTGDMVLDTGDNYFSGTGKNNDSRGNRNILEHEHGHGVGLSHVCPVNQTKLMEPFISTAYLGMQFDDIYSASRNYGDFYERHGVLRDNDSFTNAADLGLVAEVQFGVQWVCIDDSTDVDYYSFAAVSGSQVTARVIPSTASYLEGEQNSQTGACTTGTNFDSGTQHDLTLELIGPTETVLITAAATGLGGTEEIVTFTVPTSGFHYIRVTGGTSDSAQLYRLEALVEVPGVALAVQSYGISLESMLPGNGVVDPGETVAFSVDVENLGVLDATSVQGTLSGPAGFTGFTAVQGYGTITPSGIGAGTFVFGLDGSFGDSLELDLLLTADGGVSQMTPLHFTLGKALFALKENFDGGGGLPAGWTSATTSNGSGWSVVTTDSFSPSASVFSASVASVGTSALTSPQVTVSGASGILSFWHRYNTLANGDGCVLEVSNNGGAWTDIEDAGGTFLEGGYDATLGNGGDIPLARRSVWTGNSGGFLLTRVELPPALLNVSIQLRWLQGHNQNNAAEGWYVDDVELGSGLFETLGLPELGLTVVDGVASEFGGIDTAEVQVTTPLPLLTATPLSLLTSGTANAATDVTGLGLSSLPSGQTAASVVLTAVNDGEVEGPEELILDFAASAVFTAAAYGIAAVTIEDTPYGQWAFTNLGVGPLSGPLEDKDGDLFNNLYEYAWGTDGDAAGSYPQPVVSAAGGLFQITAPLSTLPADVVVFAEESADLDTWSGTGMQTLVDAFGFPLAGPDQFIRIGVQEVP